MKIVLNPIPVSAKSENLGGFREVILPQALDRTFRERTDLRALVEHDTAKILGRVSAGTLLLSKSGRGLVAEIFPPNTTYAADLIEAIRRRDVTGASFRFQVLRDDWHVEDGEMIREVSDLVLAEVSPVAFPSYPQTTAEVRSARWGVVSTVRPGLSLPMARARQRQALAMELRSLPKDGETAIARGEELAMLRWATGEQVARPRALRSAAAFLEACQARYGSLEETPLDTPDWNERSGWEDEGAGKDAFLARKVRQERAVREAAASDRAQEERDRDARRAAANWQRTMAEWRRRTHSTPRSY